MAFQLTPTKKRILLVLALLALVVTGVGLVAYGPILSTAGVPPELRPFPSREAKELPSELKPSPIRPIELKPFPKKKTDRVVNSECSDPLSTGGPLPEFVYTPSGARKRWGVPNLGFKLEVPDTVVVVPGAPDVHFKAIERRGEGNDGKQVGEITITMIAAAMMMDRDGVLRELAQQAAAEKRGQLIDDMEVEVEGGHGTRIVVQVAGDPLPYFTALTIGHTDFMIPAALFVAVRSAALDWPAAQAIVDSIRFAT